MVHREKLNEHSLEWGWDGCGKGTGWNEVEEGTGNDCGSLG